MSNVASWKRSKSDFQYVYSIFIMSEEIGSFVHKTAKKYRSTYGDKLISMSADALVEAKIIEKRGFVHSDSAIIEKIHKIEECEATLEGICTIIYIWTDILLKHDGLSKDELRKIYSAEKRVGDNADKAITDLEKRRWQLIHSIKDEELKMEYSQK